MLLARFFALEVNEKMRCTANGWYAGTYFSLRAGLSSGEKTALSFSFFTVGADRLGKLDSRGGSFAAGQCSRPPLTGTRADLSGTTATSCLPPSENSVGLNQRAIPFTPKCNTLLKPEFVAIMPGVRRAWVPNRNLRTPPSKPPVIGSIEPFVYRGSFTLKRRPGPFLF